MWGSGPAATYLEMGDFVGFTASLTQFREYSSKHRISSFEWGLTSADAMRAILLGEFAEAGRLADRALGIGELVQGEMATGVYGVQMFTIRREQGRLAEVAPLFRRFLDENPQEATWRPGLALIASDLGFEDASRRAFEDMAAARFVLPIDAKRTVTLSYLARCARVSATRTAPSSSTSCCCRTAICRWSFPLLQFAAGPMHAI
jgi:hypothetical protein